MYTITLFETLIFLDISFSKAFNCRKLQFKVKFDEQVIESACEKFMKNRTDDMELHFVFAGDYDINYRSELEEFLLEGLKKYKIKKVFFTFIAMWRSHLITEEIVKMYCKGEEAQKVSFNDDLEMLFGALRLGQEPDTAGGFVWAYFLPKLTEEEMKLVRRNDKSFMLTFSSRWLVLSRTFKARKARKAFKSYANFVFAECRRYTKTLKNSLKRKTLD